MRIYNRPANSAKVSWAQRDKTLQEKVTFMDNQALFVVAVVVFFFNLFCTISVFVHFSLLKKNCPWTRSMFCPVETASD